MIDPKARYQMRDEGTQYSDQQFSLSWPSGQPPQQKVLPREISALLEERIHAGSVVKVTGSGWLEDVPEDDIVELPSTRPAAPPRTRAEVTPVPPKTRLRKPRQ